MELGMYCTHKKKVLQNRILQMTLDAPWYVRNSTVHRDIQLSFVTETLHKTYSLHHLTLTDHPNSLLHHIPQHIPPARQLRRLRRKWHPHTALRERLSNYSHTHNMYIVHRILQNYNVFVLYNKVNLWSWRKNNIIIIYIKDKFRRAEYFAKSEYNLFHFISNICWVH